MVVRIAGDRRGQATIEYILMLSVAVAMATVLLRELIVPLGQRFNDSIGREIQRTFSESLHRFPARR